MTGAQRLVRALSEAGVTRVFTLSGHQVLAIYDACLSAGIELVHARHEAATVYMADAHAQLTGTVGVALVSAGPGMANAAGALYSTRLQESPVLLISGDTPLTHDHMGPFQALDQIALTQPLTKLSRRITDAASIESELGLAIRASLSWRPGPVHLAIPADLLESQTDAPYTPVVIRKRSVAAQHSELGRVARLLSAAKQPLIVCGPALNPTRVPGLSDSLMAGLGVPVLALESPRGMSDPSLGRFSEILARADLILSLGKSIDFGLGFGQGASPDARWILVDSDPAEIAQARRNVPPEQLSVVVADPLPFAYALLAAGAGRPRPDWCRLVRDFCDARSYTHFRYFGHARITAMETCLAIRERVAASDNSIFISDGGEFGQWAQAVVTNAGRRLINGPSANIGVSIPYAIAARKADPTATIYVVAGDGGIGFHLAEFETAGRLQTPFVAVIGNNLAWYAEQHTQHSMFGPDRAVACELSPVRYDQVVVALGGHGEHVTKAEDLIPALIRAEQSGLAACVMVDIEPSKAP